VEHRKEQREWERPSTSSSNESNLSLPSSPFEPYREGIDPTVGREEKENRESDEMIKREINTERETERQRDRERDRERECEVVTPPYLLRRSLPLLRTTITPSSLGHTRKRNGWEVFHSEDRVSHSSRISTVQT
jgi:hypothetical protein